MMRIMTSELQLSSPVVEKFRAFPQVMEHVAAELGLDPEEVKRRNFIARPDTSEPDPLAPAADTTNGSSKTGSRGGSGGGSGSSDGSTTAAAKGSSPATFSVAADGTPEVLVQAGSEAASDDAADASDAAAPRRPCFAGPAAGLASGEQVQRDRLSQWDWYTWYTWVLLRAHNCMCCQQPAAG